MRGGSNSSAFPVNSEKQKVSVCWLWDDTFHPIPAPSV